MPRPKLCAAILPLPIAVLAVVACGGGDCTPSPIVQKLLDEESAVGPGQESLHAVDKPSDANLIFIGLDWEGQTNLQLRAQSVGCACGVCELWSMSPGDSGAAALHNVRLTLAGDFSCSEAYDITVVGDRNDTVRYQLLVYYETAACAT